MSDDDAVRLLPRLTLLPMADVAATVSEHRQNEHLRGAQGVLATEVTRLVRGEEGLAVAEAATGILHGKSLRGDVSAEAADELLHCVRDGSLPGATVSSASLAADMTPIDLAVRSGVVESKASARRLAKAGGLSVNGSRVDAKQASTKVGSQALLDGKIVILGAGKARRHVVGIVAP